MRLEHAALQSDFVPFKALSHPVRISRATQTVPVNLDDHLLDPRKSSSEEKQSARTKR
ncbi:MAG TPA: hypothetical protein VNA15_03475 [Candidatus Angelobacter sp.]|nr:hypothetical protein [Candidatus Angelobacter sp.]